MLATDSSDTDSSDAASRVAAIIPTFNRADFLKDAIESVLAQGPVIAQLIVCDDGSTDDTAQVVRSFGERVTYLRQDNAGQSSAINNALRHVTAPLVWIMDDDDLALPGTITQLAAALDANPRAALAYGNRLLFRETAGGRVIKPEPERKLHSADAFHASLIRNFIARQASVYRTSVMADIGPVDPVLLRSQDWDYVLRVTARYEVVHVPIDVYLWRLHEGMRGPAAARFAASEISDKWAAYDKIVIGKVLDRVPLERFSLVADGAALRNLASAHLLRAIVACRTAVWEQAFTELDRFVELANGLPQLELTPAEQGFLGEGFALGSQMLQLQAPLGEVFARLEQLASRQLKSAIRASFLGALPPAVWRYLKLRSGGRLLHIMNILRRVVALR